MFAHNWIKSSLASTMDWERKEINSISRTLQYNSNTVRTSKYNSNTVRTLQYNSNTVRIHKK